MTKINSVYLAYPIDQALDFAQDFYALIENFKHTVSHRGVSWVFDPGDAFQVNPSQGIDPGVAVINRAALNNADAVVAFLPRKVASIGVPMEIDRARAQGKVVLVFSDTDSYMLAMPGVAQITGFSDDDLLDGLNWLMNQEVYDPGYPQWFGEIRWTGESQFEPKRGYADDAGLDLIVEGTHTLTPHEFMDIPCGISVELPERHWAMITGRSSTFRKRGLQVQTGIIDTGYRGPLFAAVYNTTGQEVTVHEGERLAQLILFSNSTMRHTLLRVNRLSPSERGEQGFGSTGA